MTGIGTMLLSRFVGRGSGSDTEGRVRAPVTQARLLEALHEIVEEKRSVSA